MDVNKVHKTMCETALEAGNLIAATAPGSVGVMQKGGTANYVTECDVRVQKFVLEKLSVFSPEIGFFGEEGEGNNSSDSGYAFIVDPIDGTSNYMFSLGLSAVSIALCDLKENKTLAAAIYCPFTRELFSAVSGGGCYLNGKQIFVSDKDMEHGLTGFGSTPYDRTVAATHMTILSDAYDASIDVRNLGTAALHLAYVAAGRFAAFYEMRLSPWDYAAGELLITEAGGKLTNFEGVAPSLTVPDSIVGGNPKAYSELLAIIKKHI